MKKILLLICLILSIDSMYASHINGGDISYQYDSANIFKFKFRIYRECSSIPFNSPLIKVVCPTGNISQTVSYTRTSIKDISVVCKSQALPCNPINQPTNKGMEEHVFEATINFSDANFKVFKDNNCCEVKIIINQCCRQSSITTLNPSDFYLEAMLNVCNISDVKNNSPVFTSKPLQTICCNNPTTYSLGVIESDGDSLSFESVAPLKSNNTEETYNTGFSAATPFSFKTNTKPPGFVIDNITGDIYMAPSNCNEVGVLNIKVTEWRKDKNNVMKKIGSVTREMLLNITTCTNDNFPPYFTGNNKYNICEGDKLCFQVGTKDDPLLPNQTVLDTTDLSMVSNIPGLKFTILDSNAREKSAQICWDTKKGDGRVNPYFMTLNVTDNHCGNVMMSIRSYAITVKKRPTSKRRYTPIGEGKFVVEVLPTDTPYSQFSYQWLVRDSIGTATGTNSNNRIDTIQFDTIGRYYVEHLISDKNNCPTMYIDTLIVSAQDMKKSNILSVSIKELHVSPNPGSGFFNILSSEDFTGCELQVYSHDGKKVKSFQIINNKFNVSDLKDGHYFIKIYVYSNIYTTDIIIIH